MGEAVMDFNKLADLYKNELVNNIVPFWLENSQDKDYGGYYTCLDQKGQVYDTDKFVWLQGREVWLFSMLYNEVQKNEEWLDCAIQGGEFLRKHGHDGDLNWYFSLNRQGEPLVQPYNIFSYCFAAMAFGQLSKATGNKIYAEIAVKTYQKILEKQDNPKGKYNKGVPATRPLKNFALPMIMCNLSLELESLLDKNIVDETIDKCIKEVMDVFYRPELGIVVENVLDNGSLSDSFEGRLVNPGHAIEAMWFIMELGVRLERNDLIEKAVDISLKMIEYGWDDKYEGIFYFMDRKGAPPQQLEWDQKLWWVHIESLISLSYGYLLTGNKDCLKWYEKVHNYTWKHFKDQDNGEWFGYLNRRGEVLLPLKGGKWKGAFHVPRGMYKCWKIFEQIHAKQAITELVV
uniref:AGE family epimerase/isomerase n=1 Tax=uncultured Draconibacterium sp. TaxID=1573823 RepID=UPI003216B6FD